MAQALPQTLAPPPFDRAPPDPPRAPAFQLVRPLPTPRGDCSGEGLRHLLATTSDALLVLDEEAIVRHLSAPAQSLFGCHPGVLRGHSLFNLCARSETHVRLSIVLRNGGFASYPAFTCRAPGGGTFATHLRLEAFRDHGGRLTCAVAILGPRRH